MPTTSSLENPPLPPQLEQEEEEEESFPSSPVKNGRATERGGEGRGGKLMVGLRRVRRVASLPFSLLPTNRLVCVVVVVGGL